MFPEKGGKPFEDGRCQNLHFATIQNGFGENYFLYQPLKTESARLGSVKCVYIQR